MTILISKHKCLFSRVLINKSRALSILMKLCHTAGQELEAALISSIMPVPSLLVDRDHHCLTAGASQTAG